MSEEELDRKGTSEEMGFQSVAENRHLHRSVFFVFGAVSCRERVVQSV